MSLGHEGPQRNCQSHGGFCKSDSWEKDQAEKVSSHEYQKDCGCTVSHRQRQRAGQDINTCSPLPCRACPAHLVRMGAETAAAAGQAVSAAQAACRVLAVDTASVCFFSIGVPVKLSVIIEAPSEARVIPPVVITFLGPRVSRGPRREMGRAAPWDITQLPGTFYSCS